MRICKTHWTMLRASVGAKGMSELVAKNGEIAFENMVAPLEGVEAPFDPLMSHHWHWTSGALHHGGLYLMAVDADARPENDGHYCPMCEIASHYPEWDAQTEVDKVSDQMAAYCREQSLIPKVN